MYYDTIKNSFPIKKAFELIYVKIFFLVCFSVHNIINLEAVTGGVL